MAAWNAVDLELRSFAKPSERKVAATLDRPLGDSAQLTGLLAFTPMPICVMTAGLITSGRAKKVGLGHYTEALGKDGNRLLMTGS